MEKIYSEEYKGHKIEIFHDISSDSPDDWGDDGAFLVHYHRDLEVKRDKIVTRDDIAEWYQGGKIEAEKEYYIFPVSAYIHSGVSLSLHYSFPGDGAGWDTSHVGAVLVKKDEAKKKKDAYRIAEATIETWNDCLSGNVYGYVIDDGDSGSVWGYYGDYEENALSAAREDVDTIGPEDFRKQVTRKRLDELKRWEMSLSCEERDAIARSVKSIEKQLSTLAGN